MLVTPPPGLPASSVPLSPDGSLQSSWGFQRNIQIDSEVRPEPAKFADPASFVLCLMLAVGLTNEITGSPARTHSSEVCPLVRARSKCPLVIRGTARVGVRHTRVSPGLSVGTHCRLEPGWQRPLPATNSGSGSSDCSDRTSSDRWRERPACRAGLESGAAPAPAAWPGVWPHLRAGCAPTLPRRL